MEILQKPIILLLPNIALTRKIVRNIEQRSLSHTNMRFYRKQLFNSDIQPQPQSGLLSLPAEVRLQIYKWAFSPPYQVGSMSSMALVSTCRLINQEAVHLALRQCRFRLSPTGALNFRHNLWNLGPLQQHLSYITIEMSLLKIDTTGPNNPFVLTQLPLHTLEIVFSDTATKGWRNEVTLYHNLISALLYRSTPRMLGATTEPIYKSILLRLKRIAQTRTWSFNPTVEELYDVLLLSRTKNVLVKCKSSQEDIIWSAFAHFGLVRLHHKKFMVKSTQGGERFEWIGYYMFYDENDMSVFRMGWYPPEGGAQYPTIA